jgi:hypothetical protein
MALRPTPSSAGMPKQRSLQARGAVGAKAAGSPLFAEAATPEVLALC